MTALDLTVSDLFPGFTLTQYAEAKKLPIEFLQKLGLKDTIYNKRSALRIPYCNVEGDEVLAVRFRLSENVKCSNDAIFATDSPVTKRE